MFLNVHDNVIINFLSFASYFIRLFLLEQK
jgi:hypothetical protein